MDTTLQRGAVESEQLLMAATSGVLRGITATPDSTPTPEREAPGLHLPTCGKSFAALPTARVSSTVLL